MKTIVFNFPAFVVGGVQQYIYGMMKYCISKKYKIIWLYQSHLNIAKEYQDILPSITPIKIPSFIKKSVKYYNLPLTEDDSVILVSFTPFEHVINLKIKELFTGYKITPFLIIANTKGRYYFIEEYFFGLARDLVYKKIQPWIENWNENEMIYYFTRLQKDAYNERYLLKNVNENNIVPSVMITPFLGRDALIKRANREEFNLITISRFDFPHKNYLLGLIDDYALLKQKYSKLTLHIIGYGQDEKIVRNKIEKLDTYIKKDIFLHGSMSRSQIDMIMQNMHLNISCAGSVSCGSRNAVLSLPARNFCGDECEVYGYLPQSAGMTTSTDSGLPAKSFIEEVINMTNEEYIEKCMDSYNSYSKRPVNPEFLFEEAMRRDANCNCISDYKSVNRLYFFRDISYKIHTEISRVLHKS